MSDPHTHVRTHLLSRSSESQLKCYNEDTDLPVPFNVIASSILLNGNPISTSAGLGSGILSLNNTWTGTNTFNNTVTVATNQTTSFSNTMIVNTNLTSATETTFTTSGNPSGVPACSLGGSSLAGSYALTASASSGAMGMNLGPFTYAINGMYYPTFVGLRGSVTNIIYYVYQYNTAGTAYVQIGGGIALTTSGQTISTEFQANSYSSYQGKIVFYFQGTGVAQSVTFTSFSMKVGRTQLNGLLQLSYNPSTPTYTLGIDENSQVIMYANPVSSIFSGSVSPAYIPYASSANGFVNSIMSQSGSQITITGSLYASGRTQLNGLLQLFHNPSTPTYTLGVDADSKVIMYANPVSSIFSGSVSPTYIPYASSANGFANSIMSQTGSHITIDGSLLLSGATNKITQAYNALTTDTTTLVNRQTLDSAISNLLTLNNTWSGTNSFSTTVSLPSVATDVASFTLGLNASYQIVKYSGIGGSVTANYIPYASSANTLGNSIMSQSGNQITIDGSLLLTGATNKITQAYNALAADTTTLVNRQTLDSAISSASRLTLSNTWTETNSFSNTVSLTSVATAAASFTLGLNASNQIVKYTASSSGIGGSVTTGYIPYASSANTLANSIIYTSGTVVSVGNASPVVSSILQSGTSPANSSYASATLFGDANPYKAQICAFNTGGQALYLGSFYTGGTGQISVIQSSSVYSEKDHVSDLSIQPNGGNVGVGVINPTYKLQVAGTGLFGYVKSSKKGIFIANEDSYGSTPCIQGVSSSLGTNDISIQPAGGNVSIGTADSPLCKLYVFGSATTGWAAQTYFGNATSGVIAGTYDNVAYIGGCNGALSDWKDLAINASGGNVAVGRITPLHKFHVQGTIAGQSILSLFPALNGGAGSNISVTAGNGAFGSIEAYNTANTVKLPLCLNPYGGNVGIGLIAPAVALDVSANGWGILCTNNSGGPKVGFYSGSGQAYVGTFNNYPLYFCTNNSGAQMAISTAGNIGLGRITADLCRVESQTSTLIACSSFYITPGPATTFFPVVFNTIPAHDTGQNKWKVTVARTSVNQDSYFKGSLLAEFEGNSSNWGNSADSFSYNIAGCGSPATYNYFVGNAYVDFNSGFLVVYLRGATTYQYSMEGASLLYYPSSSPFVSYTIANNTVLYATNTPTAPFTNTYLKYDSFTGLSTYTSASYGTVLSPLINRVGGGVKLSLIPTNGDPEYGFASYQSSGNAGGATYCNAISNTPVTDYSPTTWSGKGYTLFTPTTDPGPNKCALGIGSAGNGAYGVYGDNYITSLTPNITWTNLWISAHQTLIRYDGNLAAYSIAGGWVNVSDEREKEEIKDLKTGRSLERILACKPKFYKRKYYEKEGTPVAQSTKDAVHIGLLAQDCLQSNKHCVSTWENTQIDDEDKTRYGVNYNDYTVHLIGAVQEQQKMIETLTERSKVMEEHARDLEAQLSQSRKDLEDYKLLTEERFNKLAKMISGK